MSARSKPTDQRQLEDVRFTTADYLAATSHGLSPIEWHDRGRPASPPQVRGQKGTRPKVAGIAAAHGAGDKPPHGTSLRPWGVYRSKWEADYAKRLDLELAAGLITEWSYETERLVIGIGASYKPDFPVTMPDGSRQMREVKGYRREAAMVRLKAAALRYPEFRFVLVTRKGGEWHHTPIQRPA